MARVNDPEKEVVITRCCSQICLDSALTFSFQLLAFALTLTSLLGDIQVPPQVQINNMTTGWNDVKSTDESVGCGRTVAKVSDHVHLLAHGPLQYFAPSG